MSDDPVNRPSHYTFGAVEVIDAIEAWGLDFHRGNVVKYVARAAHKGTELEDLRKARWYLDRAIARLDDPCFATLSDTSCGLRVYRCRLAADHIGPHVDGERQWSDDAQGTISHGEGRRNAGLDGVAAEVGAISAGAGGTQNDTTYAYRLGPDLVYLVVDCDAFGFDAERLDDAAAALQRLRDETKVSDPGADEVEAIAGGTPLEFVQATGELFGARFVACGAGEGHAVCGNEYCCTALTGEDLRIGDIVDFRSCGGRLRGVRCTINGLHGSVMRLDRSLTGTAVLDDDDVVVVARSLRWLPHEHGFVKCSVCGTLCAENGTGHSRHEATCWSKA